MLQFDLSAGIGEVPAKQGDIILNVSRITEYLRCPARYGYKYILNRVSAGPTPRYLRVGRAVHAAVEAVHRDLLDVEAAERVLDETFGEVLDELKDEKAEAKTRQELAWAKHALKVYRTQVEQNRFGWKTIVAEEEPMWLRLIHAGDRDVYIKGVPDKVVVGTNDKLRHAQFKTLSPQVDPSHFAKTTRFSLHETVYGFMIEGTYGEQMDMPYQGTDLIMMPKVMPPKPPVNRTKDGRETPYFLKQMQKFEQDKLAWTERVLDRRMLALGYSWRRHMLNELADAVFGMHAMEQGVRPYVRAGGGACSRYGGPCGYLDVCAGEATLDGSGFVDRPEDYVDKVLVQDAPGEGNPPPAG